MKLEFEGLKFQTSFKFKNKREKNDYFDDLLIRNFDLFRKKQEEYFTEKLHIISSHIFVLRIMMFVMLGFVLFSLGNPVLSIINLSIYSIIFITLSILPFRYGYWAKRYMFTIITNSSDEFLEILKEETLKIKERKNGSKESKEGVQR